MAGGGQRRTRSAGAAPAPAGSKARGDAVSPPLRPRSERISGYHTRRGSQRKPLVEKKMVGSPLPAPVVKRSIMVKKIIPRKQQISPKADKENISVDSGEAERFGSTDANPVSTSSLPVNASGTVELVTPGLSPLHCINAGNSPAQEKSDMSMKVRRSYSRLDASFRHCAAELSATSTPLFGFEKLLVPDGSPVGKGAPSCKLAVVARSTAAEELDTNIPGISFAREKRKKRRVPQIDKSELDEWAAQMNAQFEEAEQFNLLVE
ncbi:sororin isoform X2 [Emydura macquarii macquarii]|uniref:sororin isoform X2 n=1 Tax=Emydura macquarii macquarii TaxID=1129001 RepID=UPI00352A4EEA